MLATANRSLACTSGSRHVEGAVYTVLHRCSFIYHKRSDGTSQISSVPYMHKRTDATT